MASKLDKILSVYKSEYSEMRKYRNVSIYPKALTSRKKFTPEEKESLLKKRWYVYYSYIDPSTGKYKRQTPIFGSLNRNFPDFDDRLREIKILRDAVLYALKKGTLDPYLSKDEESYTITSALEYALEIRKNEKIATRTYKRYKLTVDHFDQWLKDKGYSRYSIEKADTRLIGQFLNYISGKTSARNRNNYRGDLSSLFGALLEPGYIKENPISNIKMLPTAEKRDPTYSEDQVKTIMEYLEANDKMMHLFIMFVSYMFWRPIEITRIQVKDVNLKERLIAEKTKTKGLKTKLIPEILMPYLEEYIKGAEPEDYLFTPKGPGQQWNPKDKRPYFTNRYKKIKKKLKIDPAYTIYSFRHSFVTKVYKNLLKDHPKEKTMDILANITGHTSKAIQAYIHHVDADLPSDYSELLK